MINHKFTYLSYILDKNTPSYGNRTRFNISKKFSISRGDIANDSYIETTVHIGTHIDLPYHFYDEGQCIEDFHASYFYSEHVLFLSLKPKNIIIDDELINLLDLITDKEKYEFLIVKTGICHQRNTKDFWEYNYGFAPSIAEYLQLNFPSIRLFGFDSISVSSFQNRMLGRKAHKAFLNPQKPILIVEDMDLRTLTPQSHIKCMHIAPMRISNCDGLPCTVIAEVNI